MDRWGNKGTVEESRYGVIQIDGRQEDYERNIEWYWAHQTYGGKKSIKEVPTKRPIAIHENIMEKGNIIKDSVQKGSYTWYQDGYPFRGTPRIGLREWKCFENRVRFLACGVLIRIVWEHSRFFKQVYGRKESHMRIRALRLLIKHARIEIFKGFQRLHTVETR